MSLKTLSKNELLDLIKIKSQTEKSLTLEVIKLIKEIDSRRLFLELGYGSLFDYVVRELKYEEASALRRINAARLLKDIPEVEQKIEEGKLSLSNLSQVQSFFRKEEKLTASKLTVESKKEILASLENKTSREAQKILIELSPNQISLKESEKVISKDLIEIKVVINERLNNKLKKLKSLMSHLNPNMSQSELIEKLADIALNKLDPEAKAQKNLHRKGGLSKKSIPMPSSIVKKESLILNPQQKPNPPSAQKEEKVTNLKAQNKPTRYIPSTLKQEVYMRDKGCCSFKDHRTQQRCTSKYLLQYDHIKPMAFGGETTKQNLRLLCFNHHKLVTQNSFGVKLSKF